jgi:hypothetical protein
MTDILTLTDLELCKELAKAKGYYVRHSAGAYFVYAANDDLIGDFLVSEDEAWVWACPLQIEYTFPLVLEMNKWGWEVDIDTRPGLPTCVLVEAETDDAIRKARWRYYEVNSSGDTDPSDAIAKCYLLVRKEMQV